MEIRQIQYFLMLCNELHFTEAADKLGISQPTLSQQIRVIENELGTPLFDRIGKKTVLTEAGRLFRQYALQMVQQLENAKAAVTELTNQNVGLFRVAVLPSDLDYRLTPLLIDFHRDFPKTKVQVIPSMNIEELVLDNEVDLGVGLAIQPDSRLERIHFYTETYCLFVNERHDLAEKELVHPEDLPKLPIVMYPQGFYGRDLIDSWCAQHQVSIQPILETGSATSLFQFVKENIGVTIQPSQLITHFESLGIRAIPIMDSPSRQLEMYYRTDKYLNVAVRTFMERLRDYFVK
ncbi:LysR family transcriptional regulator [Brevibacillus reuszeri]|uniref:LysR family transcriptional regulator n=1 Tax=Brevibacillus reuszeri TaxID=54915 RepID=A0A0K9YQ76_9BACL|nr:LysR family transcriptional regulator [Brevibacillus reuszeri]KNB70863.1 LysR family transcriptional regulator [Brevibacillus reuszeri]MED1857258.1 LysR family transcriptional regulator [Brevibacillus reuszeri]GED66914.1 LysR family transcriptional regulator [Brevibacillus reuszeri]